MLRAYAMISLTSSEHVRTRQSSHRGSKGKSHLCQSELA